MRYIVQPVDKLRGVEGNPRADTGYFERLIAFRAEQLDQLWNRIAGEVLALDAAARADAKARRWVRILPGVGDLLLDEALPNIARIETITWLKVYISKPMPPIKLRYATGPAAAVPWHLGTNGINKPGRFNGAGVVVGVVDSGYDATQFSDFGSTFLPQFGFYDPITDAIVNGAAPQDADNAPGIGVFHGSGVCAFLAGTASGVAPAATLIVAGVPVTDRIARSDDLIMIGLDWLVQQTTATARGTGCDVISLSLQASTFGSYTPPHLHASLVDIRDLFHTLVVAAVGNEGASADKWQCPGAFDCVVSVGAVDPLGHVTSSAFGTAGGFPVPDIVAPGVSLQQPRVAGGQTIRSGTSFAAPIVAGGAALVLESTPALRFNPLGLQAKLLGFHKPATATPTLGSGVGILDLTGL